MESTKSRWGLALLWPNVAVAVVLLVLLVQRSFATWHELARVAGIAWLYANTVAVFGTVTFDALRGRSASRRLPLVAAFVLCLLVVIPAGCLGVQAVLTVLGVMPSGSFWSQYFGLMKVALPLAGVFGLGAFVHASLSARLEAAERRLRDEEKAAEQAGKLAAEARLRSIEARIRPHFLFNALNSISALIATDPARAERMVGRLATLLRTSLDTSGRPLVPLREEMVLVRSTLDLEKARFGDRLNASVEVPGELEEALVPPMSVQSLVENAVKHGITPQRDGGDVRVAVSAEDGLVRIRVIDTGPGFDLAAVPPGHGIENLVERLNALFGDRARLDVSGRKGHCVVEMVIPRA